MLTNSVVKIGSRNWKAHTFEEEKIASEDGGERYESVLEVRIPSVNVTVKVGELVDFGGERWKVKRVVQNVTGRSPHCHITAVR